MLQDEELEVLLLAKSTGATVLTLDGRFRFVLEAVAKVPGVWPQALLMHCASKDLVDPMKLAAATIRQFLTNRSFVSLGSGDLTWMVLQGGAYLQQGMRRFKGYLSSPDTEFASTVSVAFEFLSRIATLHIHLGAFGELFEHVVEAAMRHKQCPADFHLAVSNFVEELTDSLNGREHLYGAVNVQRRQRVYLQRQFLAQRFVRARDRLKEAPDNRPVAVRAVFCSPIPWLVADKSNTAPAAATELQPPAPGEGLPSGEVADAAETATKASQPGKAFLVAAPKPRFGRG